jgi:hypothetical protein
LFFNNKAAGSEATAGAACPEFNTDSVAAIKDELYINAEATPRKREYFKDFIMFKPIFE